MGRYHARSWRYHCRDVASRGTRLCGVSVEPRPHPTLRLVRRAAATYLRCPPPRPSGFVQLVRHQEEGRDRARRQVEPLIETRPRRGLRRAAPLCTRLISGCASRGVGQRVRCLGGVDGDRARAHVGLPPGCSRAAARGSLTKWGGREASSLGGSRARALVIGRVARMGALGCPARRLRYTVHLTTSRA